MWIWHTETKSVECALPYLTVEVLQIDDQLKVFAQGASEDLQESVGPAKNLGDLLVYLDRWLEKNALSASGIVGYECQAFLDKKLHWITEPSVMPEPVKGESLVFVMQAGPIKERTTRAFTKSTASQNGVKSQFAIDQETVEEITDLVSRGLAIRQELDSDHLVVSAPVPVEITDSLSSSWINSAQIHFPQGFLMKSNTWELASCTPERFISVADSKLQIEILAGTFKEGTTFDKDSLIDEHQAARSMLRSMVESTIGELQLTSDCDLVQFDEIRHFRSRFEKRYQTDESMLLTLATLTPSPATGAQDNQTRLMIQALENRSRGYYGGCFFLRTPGCLESLVSIRSVFCADNASVGEMIVGAGFKKGSTLSGESAELISKATSCAKLLGIKSGR
jgi:isochorismate synthase EntC